MLHCSRNYEDILFIFWESLVPSTLLHHVHIGSYLAYFFLNLVFKVFNYLPCMYIIIYIISYLCIMVCTTGERLVPAREGLINSRSWQGMIQSWLFTSITIGTGLSAGPVRITSNPVNIIKVLMSHVRRLKCGQPVIYKLLTSFYLDLIMWMVTS